MMYVLKKSKKLYACLKKWVLMQEIDMILDKKIPLCAGFFYLLFTL